MSECKRHPMFVRTAYRLMFLYYQLDQDKKLLPEHKALIMSMVLREYVSRLS